MIRVLRTWSVGVAVLLLTSAPAWAQATAELNGRVTDESGAVLPGVSVTATQTEASWRQPSHPPAGATGVSPSPFGEVRHTPDTARSTHGLSIGRMTPGESQRAVTVQFLAAALVSATILRSAA